MDKKELKTSFLSFLRKALLGLSVICFIACSVYLIKYYVVEPYKNKTVAETPSIDESDTQTTLLPNKSKHILAKYKELLKTNEDFVGLLRIPLLDKDDMKVVQCDDNDTYLTTNFNGEYSVYGTLFVDFRNNIEELDTNTIIYGHKMRDGQIFGHLNYYKDIENYKEYPTLKFNTIYEDGTWKIFAAFIVNIYDYQDNGYTFPYRTINFPSDEKFNEFITDVKSRSYYTNESVDIKPTDKILTLSTCCYEFEDSRFVVMARRVRDGESDEVDVSKVKTNENQKFPQAWYDANGGENPFVNAKRFSVN